MSAAGTATRFPMLIDPIVDGTTTLRSPGLDFLAAFRRRVESGLLSGRPHRRSRYVVTEVEVTRIHVRAADWPTALNVGLNQLDLSVPKPGVVEFRVQYWRWAGYAIALGGVIGIVGIALLVLFDVRSYIAASPSRGIPGLSVDQNLAVAWGMLVFWGFVWPWLLIALHRRPVRHLVERLIAEVDDDAAAGALRNREMDVVG